MKRNAPVILLIISVLFLSSCSLFDRSEVALIDDETAEYMVSNVKKDFVIEIDADDGAKATDFAVQTVYGDPVECPMGEKKGIIRINAPEGGYEDGEIYTLDLKDKGRFTDDKFKDAKKIMFFTGGDKVEYEHQENVSLLEDEAESIEVNGDSITLPGKYKEGDIILVDTNEDHIDEAYKLINVQVTGDSTSAGYSTPAYNEVYRSLDLLEQGTVDFSNVTIDEEQFIGTIEEAGIIDILGEEVEALELGKKDVKLKVEPQKDGSFKITITFEITPNDSEKAEESTTGAKAETGDPETEDERRLTKEGSTSATVTFTNTLSAEVLSQCKLNPFSTRIGCDITLKAHSGLNIHAEVEGKIYSQDELDKRIENTLKEYTENKIKKSNEKNEYSSPVVTAKIPVFQAVFAYVDLDILFESGFNGSMDFDTGVKTVTSIGVFYDSKTDKAKTNKSFKATMDGLKVELIANANASVDLRLSVGLCVITEEGLSAGVEGTVGPYTELEGCATLELKSLKKKPSVKGTLTIELGNRIRLGARVIILKKPVFKKQLYEKKWPLYAEEFTYSSGEKKKTESTTKPDGGSTAPSASKKEIDEALRLYGDLIEENRDEYAGALGSYMGTADKSAALYDLNKDGIPELITFLFTNEYGYRMLHVFTVRNGRLVDIDYSYLKYVGDESAGRFIDDMVSWGPRYAVFIDSNDRLCLETEQGGATSGTYMMRAWNVDKNVELRPSYDCTAVVYDTANSSIELDGWIVPETADMDWDGKKNSPVDSQECVDRYKKEIREMKRPLLLRTREDSTIFSDSQQAEAESNSMTFDEFLDYVR